MRNFIAKLAVVAGVGAAALALPATAFASTTPGHNDGPRDPRPCPAVTVNTPGTLTAFDNKCDPRGSHDGEHNGNQWDHCKFPVLRSFTDFQQNGNRGHDSQGRGDSNWNNDWRQNDWRLPCNTHHQVRCARCVVHAITFNLRHGSATATELSGPVLWSGEQVKYNGVTYFLVNVLGNHFSFAHSWSGAPIVRHGFSIRNGIATTVCPKDRGHRDHGHGHGHDFGFVR